MAPIFNEFEDERALAEEVQSRISQGTSRTTIMSYRTRMIGPNASRTKPRPVRLMNPKGPSPRGITKGDELRAILHDFGFSKQESSDLEEKLDRGRILLVDTGN